MKTQIEIKSILCGIVVGVLAVFVIGAGTSSNPIGKYQMQTLATPNGGFAFVVDTQTGEVWSSDVRTTDWNAGKQGSFFNAK